MIDPSKKELRVKYIGLRDATDPKQRAIMDQQIVSKIRKMEAYQKATIVGIFYPIGSETDLSELFRDPGKQFCFPKILDLKAALMEFRFGMEKTTEGPFRTKEPTGGLVDFEAIDLILVPGVAFSKDGVRLGYGKGFFDRYLKQYHHHLVGVSYSFQLADHLPQDEFDVLFDSVITDGEVLCIRH